MSKSSGRPPLISDTSFINLVHECYDFKHVNESSVKRLPSYYDANFYFRGTVRNSDKGEGTDCTRSINDTEEEFVLKILNTFNTYERVVGLSALWTHLQMKGLDYTRQLMNKRRSTVTTLTMQELLKLETDGPHRAELKKSAVFSIRVMRFVPGEIFDKVDKKHLTPKLMYEVGAFIGKVDTALHVRL